MSEHLLERLAAFNEGTVAEVDCTSLQEVECDECYASVRLIGVGVCEVDAALKVLEPCRLTMLVEGDDLPVQHERSVERLRPSFQGVGDFRKLSGFVVAETRPERDVFPPRLDLDNGSDAVVLRFVHESGVVEPRAAGRREHWTRDGGRRHPPIMTDARASIPFQLQP